MRAWIIALLSLVAAAAATTGLALVGLRLPLGPPADLLAGMLPHAPTLAIVAVATYALTALLATTAILVDDMMRLGARLSRLADIEGLAYRDIVAAFAGSKLARLEANFAPTESMVGMSDGIRPGEVRGEISRLHYIWLARTHFFTACVLLAAGVAFAVAQDRQLLVALPSPIPTVWACLFLSGLILLAGSSRLVVDVASEPVVRAMLRVFRARPETRRLQRISELIETAGAITGARSPTAAPRPVSAALIERLAKAVEDGRSAWLGAVADLSARADALQATLGSSATALQVSLDAALRPEADPLIERLTLAVEEGRGAWLDAIADLSARTDALHATMSSSAAALQGSLDAALKPDSGALIERLTIAVEEGRGAWLDAAAGLAVTVDSLRATVDAAAQAVETSLKSAMTHSPTGESDAARLAELQSVMERLTTAVERLGAASEVSGTRENTSGQSPARDAANDRLAEELAKLLREIEVRP